MSASNAAYAEQFAENDWNIPSLHSFQRADTSNRKTDSSFYNLVSTGIIGSQPFYNSEGLIKIESSNEADRPFFGAPVNEGYMYINTTFADRETGQARSEQQQLLDRLQQGYIFGERSKIVSFLEDRPSLPQILLEALPHLAESFGPSTTLQLQLPVEEDVPVAIYAVALWRGTLEDARTALQHFDDSWWSNSSKRASGRIVFDYQLV
jgi:hypothetical protein